VRGGMWTLIDPTEGDRQLDVDVTPVMSANHSDTLMRATITGAGISSQPTNLVAPFLKSGELRRVLAPWITNRLRLVAALPSRQFMPARTRAFLDHLVDHTQRSLSGLGVAS
jgi:DNA-binding transcriptional LysR family regulator